MLITERTGYKMSGDNEGLIVTPEPLQKMYPAGEESEEWEWWKPEAQQEWLSSGQNGDCPLVQQQTSLLTSLKQWARVAQPS